MASIGKRGTGAPSFSLTILVFPEICSSSAEGGRSAAGLPIVEFCSGFHPWLALRNGQGDPKAVAFVQSLNEDLFNTALQAFEIQAQDLDIYGSLSPADGLFLVPSCGDIPEVKGLISPALTWDTSSWHQWIDDVQVARNARLSRNVTAADILEMSADAALFRLRGVTPPATKPRPLDIGQNAEHNARRAVGPAFDRLCKVARVKIVDAERTLQSGVSGDYAPVIHGYASAFECQIDESIISPIKASWQHPGGVVGAMPGKPLPLEDWPFRKDVVSLGELAHELCKPASRFASKVGEQGLDPSAVLKAINDVRNHRNDAAHTASYSMREAREILKTWLRINRPDRPNIFARILPIAKPEGDPAPG